MFFFVFCAIMCTPLIIAVVAKTIYDGAKERRLAAQHEQAMLAQERYRALLSNCYKEMAGYFLRRRFDGVDQNASMAVDDQRGRLCLITTTTPRFHGISVDGSEIMSVKVVESGTSYRETNVDRNSQIAGAMIGEMLGGATGELIGGLSARRVTTSHRLSTGIELQIAVESMDYPLWHIAFSRHTLDKSSDAYLEIREQARQWEAALKVLMRQAKKKPAAAKRAAVVRAEVVEAPPPPLPIAIEPKFYVARGGETQGEFRVSEIQAMIDGGALSLDEDLWFDASAQDWRPLIELPAVMANA